MPLQTPIDAAVAVASARMDRLAAAQAYAGDNPMAHHARRPITEAGDAGAAQMFTRLLSADLPKFQAGEALVRARTNRALGNVKGTHVALRRAAEWRRLAYVRSAH